MKTLNIKRSIIVNVILLLLFFAFLFYKAGDIPSGLFCDEAQIGNVSYQLSKGNVYPYFIPPFFYTHFHYVYGYLPIISTAPFVLLFQLSEFTVRSASITYSIISLAIIYLILRELKVKTTVPLLLLGFSPLFFHVSRTNFGHTPAFLLLSLGLYFYIKSVQKKRLYYLIISAVMFGISCYGYAGYMVGTPIFLASLAIGEILYHKFHFLNYRRLAIFFAIFFIAYLPILHQFYSNPVFSQRLKDKNNNETVNILQKLPQIITNYPKYYSFDYLFIKGEAELPGSFITRHSIKGNGIYLLMYLPLLIIAFLGLFFVKDTRKRFFLPFFVFFFLSPIPDLLTTKNTVPPYSFSLFYSLISIPFISAYALKTLDVFFRKKVVSGQVNMTLSVVFIIVLLYEIATFLTHYYNNYPLYSSDFWGWQYGPKKIISYFKSETRNYDELYMTGYFNEPSSLLVFYNYDNKCPNCFIGGFDKLNPNKKQLFALRTEEMNNLTVNSFLLKKIIYLPNNQAAYYIIEPKTEE